MRKDMYLQIEKYMLTLMNDSAHDKQHIEFGKVLDGRVDDIPSFFREYNWKLKNIYDKFYTDRATIIAEEHRKASTEFYENIYNEVCLTHQKGLCLLNDELGEDKEG